MVFHERLHQENDHIPQRDDAQCGIFVIENFLVVEIMVALTSQFTVATRYYRINDVREAPVQAPNVEQQKINAAIEIAGPIQFEICTGREDGYRHQQMDAGQRDSVQTLEIIAFAQIRIARRQNWIRQ